MGQIEHAPVGSAPAEGMFQRLKHHEALIRPIAVPAHGGERSGVGGIVGGDETALFGLAF